MQCRICLLILYFQYFISFCTTTRHQLHQVAFLMLLLFHIFVTCTHTAAFLAVFLVVWPFDGRGTIANQRGNRSHRGGACVTWIIINMWDLFSRIERATIKACV